VLGAAGVFTAQPTTTTFKNGGIHTESFRNP